MTKPPAKRDEVTLRRAHDVRALRICDLCGGLGNRPRMLVLEGKRIAHGSCVVETMPRPWLLNLPAAELGKLTLRELGGDAELVAAVMDKLDEAKR
jgi:hypothetical protein